MGPHYQKLPYNMHGDSWTAAVGPIHGSVLRRQQHQAEALYLEGVLVQLLHAGKGVVHVTVARLVSTHL